MERRILLDEVCGKAAELVLTHNMRHEEVTKAIRDHLLDRANELPKIPVLYNGCYGGFGFSEEFKSFRKGKKLEAYDAILKLGQQLQQQHPEVYRTLYFVEHLALKGLVSDMCCLHDTEQDLAWTHQQLESLSSSTGGGKMDEISRRELYQLRYKHTSLDCSVLSSLGKASLKAQLIEGISALSGELRWQKQKLQKQSDNPDVLRSDIARWAGATFQERRGVQRRHDEKLTFMRILTDSPEHWASCSLFHEGEWKLAIQYAKTLLNTPPEGKLHSIIDIGDERAHDNTVWVLGSRAASGEYADLKVTWVPQLVEYKVDDYDGLQTVRW